MRLNLCDSQLLGALLHPRALHWLSPSAALAFPERCTGFPRALHWLSPSAPLASPERCTGFP